MDLKLERYTDAERALWDAFIDSSKNGTFILRRGYLEYHRDRFADHSLVARSSDGTVVALLPAHRRGDTLSSHSGLTYGGWITNNSMKTATMCQIWQAMLTELQASGIRTLGYRPSPHIYHSFPSEEDLYCLGTSGARLVRRSPLSVVSLFDRMQYQERRRRGIRNALRSSVEVRESEDWESYWNLLQRVLDERHVASPVHTLSEIRQLQELFPRNIRLFAAHAGSMMIAGVVVYDTGFVARAQYIAANEEGRIRNALDLLFDYLLGGVFKDRRFFDLGSSDGSSGDGLNQPLIEFKEGFGARTVVLDTYELDVSPSHA